MGNAFGGNEVSDEDKVFRPLPPRAPAPVAKIQLGRRIETAPAPIARFVPGPPMAPPAPRTIPPPKAHAHFSPAMTALAQRILELTDPSQRRPTTSS